MVTLDCKIGLNFYISHRNMYKLAKLSSKCLLLFNCEDIACHNAWRSSLMDLISHSQANLKGKNTIF